MKSEALQLITGDLQTAQASLEQLALGTGDTTRAASRRDSRSSRAAPPNPAVQEGLSLVAGPQLPDPSSDGLVQPGRFWHAPGSDGRPTLPTTASSSRSAPDIPEVQNCNGSGSGATTVSTGTHPLGVAYDTTNNDVYVTDYKSGTVSVMSNVAVVGTVTLGGNP